MPNDLKAQRDQILAEIKRRGGAAKAPGFAKQLEAINAKIRSGPVPGGNDAVPATTEQVQQTQTDIAGAGGKLALDRLQTGGFNQAFVPALTPRMSEGDLLAGRDKTEQAVYDRLTRNVNRDYDRERQQVEQDLYNRGIPMAGADAQGKPQGWYQRPEYQGLTDRYDAIRSNAANQAREAGLGEYSTMFGLGETQRQNQYAEQAGTRNQNLSEIGNLSTVGVPGVLSFEQLSDADKDRLMQQALAKLQARTSINVANIGARASGGGGGGGGGEDLSSSPFNSSM